MLPHQEAHAPPVRDATWHTMLCVMRVRCRAGNQTTVHQVLCEIVVSATVQARCVDLSQTAALDPAVKDVPVAADARVALDMGKDGGDAL